MQQYFLNYKVDNIVTFDLEQEHHISRVLRMKNNDEVRVVDIDSNVFLVSLNFDNGLIANVIKQLEDNKNDIEITLIASLIKKDKWDFLIQKACELGVSTIVPLNSKRCVVKEKDNIDKKLVRWNKIALEACEQSKRSSLAKVVNPISMKQINDYKSDINLIAYEDANYESNKLSKSLNKQFKSITILVGCEGGFDISEVEYAIYNNFECVSLGKNILRAETASMHLISTIKYQIELNEVSNGKDN